MEWFQLVGAVLATPVSVLGITGGLISLTKTINECRHNLRPRGKRGGRFIYIGRDYWHYHFWALGGIEQILIPVAKELVITHFDKVGEYYEFRGKAEADREFSLVKKPA